ncbi:hypothetical protein ABZ307_43075 [Streptomyces griseorubiginosus]|uniref:hypothetical protein n=1 Tax=Streptomyces griseorubiginosus TaxID=67304 RepID=UPI0033B91A9D
MKDEAGFDAPTIDVIAARTDIARSTLYAVMGGKRIPTVPILAALVRAWNGDEAEWLTRRTEAVAAVARLREQHTSTAEDVEALLKEAEQTRNAAIREAEALKAEAIREARRVVDEGIQELREVEQRRDALVKEAEELLEQANRQASLAIAEAERQVAVLMRRREDINVEISRVQDVIEALESFEAPIQTVKAGSSAPARTHQDAGLNEQISPASREAAMQALYGHFVDRARVLEKLYQDRPTVDLVAQLDPNDPNLDYDEREREVLWKLLRQRAGAPTIRAIAEGAGGLRQTMVSEVLRGRVPAYTGPVLDFLITLIPADPAGSAE